MAVKGGDVKCSTLLFFGDALPRPNPLLKDRRHKADAPAAVVELSVAQAAKPGPKKAPVSRWEPAGTLYAQEAVAKAVALSLSAVGQSAANERAIRRAASEDAKKAWVKLDVEARAPYLAREAAGRTRYEAAVVDWNAAHPEDPLVLTKAGLAVRPPRKPTTDEKSLMATLRVQKTANANAAKCALLRARTHAATPLSLQAIAKAAKRAIITTRAKRTAPQPEEDCASLSEDSEDDGEVEVASDGEQAEEGSEAGSGAQDSAQDSDDEVVISDDDSTCSNAAAAAGSPSKRKAAHSSAAPETPPSKRRRVPCEEDAPSSATRAPATPPSARPAIPDKAPKVAAKRPSSTKRRPASAEPAGPSAAPSPPPKRVARREAAPPPATQAASAKVAPAKMAAKPAAVKPVKAAAAAVKPQMAAKRAAAAKAPAKAAAAQPKAGKSEYAGEYALGLDDDKTAAPAVAAVKPAPRRSGRTGPAKASGVSLDM